MRPLSSTRYTPPPNKQASTADNRNRNPTPPNTKKMRLVARTILARVGNVIGTKNTPDRNPGFHRGGGTLLTLLTNYTCKTANSQQ